METIDFSGFSAKNTYISSDLATTWQSHNHPRIIVIAYNFHERVENIYISRYNMTIQTIHLNIYLGGSHIMEIIRPSSDLRNHYNEISKQCHEERKPVIITVNGRGDTAVLGLQDYYQMKSELELLRTLSEAEEDVTNGRIAPMQDSFDDIRKSLLEKNTNEV